jgi:exonuclease III
MNALVWNVRGLNNPSKQYEVKKQISKHKASLVCLVETRIKDCNLPLIKDKFLVGLGCETCFSDHHLCRI